jgi:hypothetical protein
MSTRCFGKKIVVGLKGGAMVADRLIAIISCPNVPIILKAARGSLCTAASVSAVSDTLSISEPNSI